MPTMVPPGCKDIRIQSDKYATSQLLLTKHVLLDVKYFNTSSWSCYPSILKRIH